MSAGEGVPLGAPSFLHTHTRGPAERALLGALEPWTDEQRHSDLRAADDLIRAYAHELAVRIRESGMNEAADLIDPETTELVFE